MAAWIALASMATGSSDPADEEGLIGILFILFTTKTAVQLHTFLSVCRSRQSLGAAAFPLTAVAVRLFRSTMLL